MYKKLIVFFVYSFCLICSGHSEEKQPSFRLGFVGSLTGFAASYGQAVLEGVQLSVTELKEQGNHIELFIEDDQSVTKNTINAYTKLRTVDHIDALIGGSWWVNSISAADKGTELGC